MKDRITRACLSAGAYTLSVGTMDPAVVLARLLDALAELDADAHRAMLAPGGEYASVPAAMLQDGSHPGWCTQAGSGIVERIILAINAAAPKNFCCVLSGLDRLELFHCEPPPRRGEGVAPSARRCVSAVRERVRGPAP